MVAVKGRERTVCKEILLQIFLDILWNWLFVIFIMMLLVYRFVLSELNDAEESGRGLVLCNAPGN